MISHRNPAMPEFRTTFGALRVEDVFTFDDDPQRQTRIKTSATHYRDFGKKQTYACDAAYAVTRSAHINL
jgi:hypothetical protein